MKKRNLRPDIVCLFEKLTGYPHNLDLFTFQGTLASPHLK